MKLTADRVHFYDITICDMNRYGVFERASGDLSSNTRVELQIDDSVRPKFKAKPLPMMVVLLNKIGIGVDLEEDGSGFQVSENGVVLVTLEMMGQSKITY